MGFTDSIILYNFLFVLTLQSSLISISQLNYDFNCFVEFNSNLYVMHELHSREVIGMGKRRDGVYYLRQGFTVQAVSVPSSLSLELWHHQLGHPSKNVVNLLPLLNNCRGHLNKSCEVYHRDKHS